MKTIKIFLNEKLVLSKSKLHHNKELSSDIKILKKLWDSADIRHAQNVDMLESSWVEEQYCEDYDINIEDLQWDKHFYEYCIDEFKKQLWTNTDEFKQNDDNLIYIARNMKYKGNDIPNVVDIKWSFNDAKNMFDRNVYTHNIHIEGLARPEDVDWGSTIVHYLIDPQETTIYLNEDADIELTLITDLKSGKIILNDTTIVTTKNLED